MRALTSNNRNSPLSGRSCTRWCRRAPALSSRPRHRDQGPETLGLVSAGGKPTSALLGNISSCSTPTTSSSAMGVLRPPPFPRAPRHCWSRCQPPGTAAPGIAALVAFVSCGTLPSGSLISMTRGTSAGNPAPVEGIGLRIDVVGHHAQGIMNQAILDPLSPVGFLHVQVEADHPLVGATTCTRALEKPRPGFPRRNAGDR